MPLSPTDRAALVAYFGERPRWGGIWAKALAKYRSLGRVGGAIRVTHAEADALRLIGCAIRGVSLPLAELDRALHATRFGCGLVDALEAITGHPVSTRAADAEQEAEAWAAVQRAVTDDAEAFVATVPLPATARERLEDVASWLSADKSYLRSEWRRDPAATSEAMHAVARALLTRPGRLESLTVPVFANLVTRDPHAFDADRPAGRYLERALWFVVPSPLATLPSTADGRVMLLEAANLVPDRISSSVTALGLVGGHPVVCAARTTGVVLTLPALTVPMLGDVRGYRDVAFVVENPSVFAELEARLRRVPPEQRPTLLCTSGNLSLAAWDLLQRLVDGGTILRYAGDFDTAGLAIASRICRAYGDRITLWHMALTDYQRARAAPYDAPRPESAEMMASIDDADALLARILTDGPAYQESLVPLLAEELLAFAGFEQ